jgi:long-chain acyl-CoA synthetase
VREISVPASYALAPEDNLTDVIVDNAARRPNLAILARPGPGGWSDVTSTQFLAEVIALAKGLVASGVQPGDHIGLLSKTRYEWTLFDFAIWFTGAIPVPIYETSSPEQVRWILADSGAVSVVVETTEHEAMINDLRSELPGLKQIFTIDAGVVADLTSAGSAVDEAELEKRRKALTADSIATLIYTSGTTGRPKGVELTHANFLGLGRGAPLVVPEVLYEGATTLLFLPLAHVFARYTQILSLVIGSKLGHSPVVANLLDDMASLKPTYILAVPRVFEKIYNGAEAKAHGAGRGAIFDRAADTAVAYSEALDNGGPGLALKLKHALFDRLVYSKLRAVTGGNLMAATSGGAPLGKRLSHFFRGVGLPVLEGYGLTETTGPCVTNTYAKNKVGTVGPPLPGVSIRIADDNEIQVKGVGVLHGYHNNPPGMQAVQDGWVSTGDLGSLDDDGYLSIIGRKKEILVTAGGKNVIPAMLEDKLRAHPLISQCIVVGDQKPFIACLITLDAEMLPTWLSNHGQPALSVTEAAEDPTVRAELQVAVDAANSYVSKAETIRKFSVLTTDFTEASGHLTPKQSLKRSVVMKDFATEVEALYS